MREVGDRFQNMYFAADKGNWALAAYMSKYMNGAMNPAALTKAAEYKVWNGFYEANFAEVNKAIQTKDLPGFKKAYTALVCQCWTVSINAPSPGLAAFQFVSLLLGEYRIDLPPGAERQVEHLLPQF